MGFRESSSLQQKMPPPALLGRSKTSCVYAVDDDYVRKEIKITSSSYGIPFPLEVELLHNMAHPYLLMGYGVEISHDYLNIYLPRAKGDLTEITGATNVLLRFFYEISLALLSLHEKDIVHLDIKPDNVLIFTKDEIPVAKLGDFGHAHYLPESSLSRIPFGTFSYLPPETIKAIRYNRAIVHSKDQDMWSLGLTFFLVLTRFFDYDMVNGFVATPCQLERKARNYFYEKRGHANISKRLADLDLTSNQKELLADLFSHLLVEESSRWSIEQVVMTLEKVFMDSHPFITSRPNCSFMEIATWPCGYEEPINYYLTYFPDNANAITIWLRRLLYRLSSIEDSLTPDEVVPVLVYMSLQYLGSTSSIRSFLTKTSALLVPTYFVTIQGLIFSQLYPRLISIEEDVASLHPPCKVWTGA